MRKLIIMSVVMMFLMTSLVSAGLTTTSVSRVDFYDTDFNNCRAEMESGCE